MREQGCDWFLLCCTERINISHVQFAFVSPEKEGLISSHLSPYTKETCWVAFTWLAVKWGVGRWCLCWALWNAKAVKCSLLSNKLALQTAIFFKGNGLSFLHLSIHMNKQADRGLARWRKRFHPLLLINNNRNSKSMNGHHSICTPLCTSPAWAPRCHTHCSAQDCPFLMHESKFLLTVFALPPESSSSKDGKNFGNACRWAVVSDFYRLQLLALTQDTH